MTNQQSKAGKAHVYGTPLIALTLAVLGYLDNRRGTENANDKASRAHDHAQVEARSAQVEAQAFSEVRLRKAYAAMQEAIDSQAQRVSDLESWVAELEEFVEDEMEADSPSTRRERAARDTRLEEIRAAKVGRRTARPKPTKVPDFDLIQSTP